MRSVVRRRRAVSCVMAAAALLAAATLGACDDDEEPKDKGSLVNLEAYQGFFAHYPFGGHPVATWSDRLNALAPGGAEANPAAYQLARSRAEQAGLMVSGEGQAHVVRIKPELLKRLIDHVDEQKESESE